MSEHNIAPMDMASKVKRLEQAIADLKGGFSGDHKVLKQYLRWLYEFECWDLYFKHISPLLKQGDTKEKKRYYQQALMVAFNVIEDPVIYSQYLVAAAKEFDLPFSEFWKLMISETMKYKDYHLEAQTLESLSLESKGDFLERILERLALIYEEKLYREDLIHHSFERLLKANQSNRRALVFFKNFSMQRQEWVQAETYLKSIIRVLADTPEDASYRLELAHLYFHYLDESDLALQVVAGIEPKAGYRVFKAKFMLMYHAGEYKHSIETLRTLEQLAEDSQQLALVYFHYASIYGSLNNMKRAFRYYEKSLDKNFHVVVARKYGAHCARYSYYVGIANMLGYIAQHAERKSHRLRAKQIIKTFKLGDLRSS